MHASSGTIPKLALCALLVSPATQAHHSFAMYDTKQEITLTGKLTRFIPGANHAQLIFELLDENGGTQLDEAGRPVMWGIETGPSGVIARQGVTVKDFPEGTIMTVQLNPLRDGRTFGVQAGPIVKCGNTLPAGGCTAETGEILMPDNY